QSPAAPVNMTGVQLAISQPNECFQASSGLSPTNPLETPPSTSLPPVVWIHGEGYLAGSASAFSHLANGEEIIQQSSRGVVVALIQYRLGVFGKSLLHHVSSPI
ncbi:hypothetical protein B0H19DRAFT_1322939, partial [Mycena capillaripes]